MTVKQLKDIKECVEYTLREVRTGCCSFDGRTVDLNKLLGDIEMHITIEQRLSKVINKPVSTTDVQEAPLHLISEDNLMTMINLTTYETYARLYRKLATVGLKPTFDMYKQNLMFDGLDSISDNILQFGYDFIVDLFSDNESMGKPCDDIAVANKEIDQVLAMIKI